MRLGNAQYYLREEAPPATTVPRVLRKVEEPRRAVPAPWDLLGDWLGSLIAARWPRPCEAAFDFLATHHPFELGKLIVKGQLSAADLTFAAEAFGRTNSRFVRPVLLRLLEHRDPVVREGAIIGLQGHLDLELRGFLQRMADEDPSPGVRMAAEDALSDP